MRILLATFLTITASCGGPGSAPAGEPSGASSGVPGQGSEGAAPPEQQPAIVTFHEWGLLDVDLATGIAELASGPGAPARPVIARKPVLYAHLGSGVDRAQLELRVAMPGGSFLEHWPAGVIEEGALRWALEVSRGQCPRTSSPGAARDRSRACDTPDGFCEVDELPRYVTDDHDCMMVGGMPAALLFYRAQIPIASLPITVRREAALTVRASSLELPSGPRAMLRISTGLSGPWPVGHRVIARAERAQGEVVIPVGNTPLDPGAERAAMEEVLRGELRLSASEARVFLDTWAPVLFGSGAQPPQPPQDVLIYWLSRPEIERMAPILATAPADLDRAWLVRVVLGPVITAGPAPTR